MCQQCFTFSSANLPLGHDIWIVTPDNNCDDGTYNPDRCVRVLVLAYSPFIHIYI